MVHKPKLKVKYKVPIGFNCTDSFWPLTCRKIQIGAHASVQLKTIVLLYLQNLNFRRSYIITTVSSSTSTSVLLDAILLVTDFASSRDFAIRSLVLLATLVVGALELVEGIIIGFSRD